MKKTYFFTILFIFSILLLALQQDAETPKITKNHIQAAEAISGLSFTDAERDSLLNGVNQHLDDYEKVRAVELDNSVFPAVQFNPIPHNAVIDKSPSEFTVSDFNKVKRPKFLEKVAFWTVKDLAFLIKSRQVTSLELTQMYLNRLKKYDKTLKCVITLTEDLAIEQAKRADAEIAAGNYRGLLHGIPYGAKDLLSVKGYKTTWGAMPYKDQVIDKDATVIKKLEEAGAVLVAKLSLGALAWGDVWFDGVTKNPWNIEQGSSGSSAGPGSATAAGLVGFSIGSETWGSIVSPSTRNRVSGLRPTYGRVSRAGAMALSWSMDKLGPMARSAEDCAIIFNAIYGTDGEDPTVLDMPFRFDGNKPLEKIRVGYLKSAFVMADSSQQKYLQDAIIALTEIGIQLEPIEMPKLPVFPLGYILSAEAAAAFDVLTRSNQDDKLVRQIKNAWPNVFREARFIPAVEYINANRVRYMWQVEMAEIFKKVDVYVTPSFGENLLLTNLTAHPCVVVPNGGADQSISFIGNLFDEGNALRIAIAYQEFTKFHLKHPVLSGM